MRVAGARRGIIVVAQVGPFRHLSGSVGLYGDASSSAGLANSVVSSL